MRQINQVRPKPASLFTFNIPVSLVKWKLDWKQHEKQVLVWHLEEEFKMRQYDSDSPRRTNAERAWLRERKQKEKLLHPLREVRVSRANAKRKRRAQKRVDTLELREIR